MHSSIKYDEHYVFSDFPRVGAAYMSGTTLLPTPDGLRSAKDLEVGQDIICLDGTLAKIVDLQKRVITPAFPEPFLGIPSGLLGAESDLLISSGNIVLIEHWACAALFGNRRLLAYALDLFGSNGMEWIVKTEGEIVWIGLDRPSLCSVQGTCLLMGLPAIRHKAHDDLPVLSPEGAAQISGLQSVMFAKAIEQKGC